MKRFSLDAMQWEAIARMSLSFLASFSFAIASMPNAIPPAFANVVGILGGICAVLLPKLQFGVVVFPVVIVFFVVVLLAMSALLAAATVSNGLMTGMYSVWALYVSGFWFGKGRKITKGFANVIICFAGIMTTSFRGAVQDGLSASYPLGSDPTETSGLARLILTALCEAQQSVPLENCNVGNLTAQATGQLPSDLGNALAGQPITVSIEDGTLSASIPGGLWLVSAFWTEKGLENPLAVCRNFMLALCWACVALLAMVFLPYPRTFRKLVSQKLLPGAISQLVKIYSSHSTGTTDKAAAAQKFNQGIAPLWSVVAGGEKAKLIFFEPRLCKAPFENIQPQLKELMQQVDKAILQSLLYFNYSIHGLVEDTGEAVEKYFGHIAVLLGACAKALASGDAGDAAELQNLRNEPHADDAATAESLHFKGEMGVIQRRCENVSDATIDWLNALDCKYKKELTTMDKLKNIRKVYLPWFLLDASPLLKLFNVLTYPFSPRKDWSLKNILWSVKLTCGFVALFCMDNYWPAWENFRFDTAAEPISGVFHGWALYGYAFAWQITWEGTIKKGIQRFFGTCFGGFLGWLGVIVAAWSYDDAAPINPYGLIAWLTVTCTITSMFTVSKSFKAFMGEDHDHGTSGRYAIMVEIIIAIDVFVHDGSKNDLLANRLVSTLVGIAMAMVISSFPPRIVGGDPEHARHYFLSIQDAMTRFLKDIVDDSIHTEKHSEKVYLADAREKGQNALLLLKDASKLAFIKPLRPSEKLMPLLQDLLMTESLFANLVESSIYAKENYEEDWPDICSAAKRFSEDGPDSFSADELEPGNGVRRALFITWARTLHERMKKHEETLGGEWTVPHVMPQSPAKKDSEDKQSPPANEDSEDVQSSPANEDPEDEQSPPANEDSEDEQKTGDGDDRGSMSSECSA